MGFVISPGLSARASGKRRIKVQDQSAGRVSSAIGLLPGEPSLQLAMGSFVDASDAWPGMTRPEGDEDEHETSSGNAGQLEDERQRPL